MRKHKILVNNYFKAFNQRNVKGLKILLDENISLEDWEGKYVGISEVLGASEKIFQEFPELNIEVLHLTFSEILCCAEIRIKLTGDLTIKVVDIFEFENENISKIRAYQQ